MLSLVRIRRSRVQLLQLLGALVALGNGLFGLLALVYLKSVAWDRTYTTASQRLQDTEDSLGMARLAGIELLGRGSALLFILVLC